MPARAPLPMRFGPSPPLRGTAVVPGDKSISHRALILAALARGASRLAGLSDGADVAATMGALAAMGASFSCGEDGAWLVSGVGVGSLVQPSAPLDMGNSGTSARLLAGLVATHPITATFIGDASLCRRPMGRIAEPLRRTGAEVFCAPGGRLPMTVRGLAPAAPCIHHVAVPSAQMKSALLLSALNRPGLTTIIERVATRDHLERMLPLFGAALTVEDDASDRRLSLAGEARLQPVALEIPADPSAAAFLAVAALIVPGSELRIPNLCINPHRTGLFDTLAQMGADLRFENRRIVSGEPVADLLVRYSALAAVDVPPERAPAMIDEYPLFFVAASFAEGTSRARGLGELRFKESDRMAAMAGGLRAIGAQAVEEEEGDALAIRGTSGAPLPGGAIVASELDHRIAMAFAVAGLRCAEPLGIDDMSPVATSFPGFARLLGELAR